MSFQSLTKRILPCSSQMWKKKRRRRFLESAGSDCRINGFWAFFNFWIWFSNFSEILANIIRKYNLTRFPHFPPGFKFPVENGGKTYQISRQESKTFRLVNIPPNDFRGLSQMTSAYICTTFKKSHNYEQIEKNACTSNWSF